MNLHQIIDTIRSLRYWNYKALEVNSTIRFNKVDRNVINEKDATFQMLILEGKINLVNKGTLRGIILAQDADVYNYGLIEGVVFSKNGILHLMAESRISGIASSKMIGVQPGCSVDAWFGEDRSIFWGELQKHVNTIDFTDITRIVNSDTD